MKRMLIGPMQFTPYRPWSEERKAAFRAMTGSVWIGKKAWIAEQMWADGCSLVEIAGATGTTKGSVCGYIQRRGLQRARTGPRVKPSPEPVATMTPAPEVRPPEPEQAIFVGMTRELKIFFEGQKDALKRSGQFAAAEELGREVEILQRVSTRIGFVVHLPEYVDAAVR